MCGKITITEKESSDREKKIPFDNKANTFYAFKQTKQVEKNKPREKKTQTCLKRIPKGPYETQLSVRRKRVSIEKLWQFLLVSFFIHFYCICHSLISDIFVLNHNKLCAKLNLFVPLRF